MTGRRIEDTNRTDPQLIEYVAELADRIATGETVDLEAVARTHPEAADRLRHLLPAVAMLADLGAATGDWNGALGPPPSPLSASPVAAEPLGQLGDFEPIREIGRGGMGVVYEARQISLNRRVALKMLPMAAAMDPKHLRRFHIEAQAAAALHHSHIVPVYAVGCERGVHYYAMQFIDGRSLAEIIRQAQRLDTPETTLAGSIPPDPIEEAPDVSFSVSASGPNPNPNPARPTIQSPSATARTRQHARNVATLGIQAAEALEHAHDQGILHRDIKPANLLIDSNGILWITDFGLARLQDDAGLTLTGDLVGTIRYMSPEQASSRRVAVDGRTDVYSLGVTLYELLTFRPAFDEADRRLLLRRIVEEEPRPPRRINPMIPADLETILGKAMAKEPADRYASAGSMAGDLRRFLENRPIEARRPSSLDRLAKWGRRHLAAVATAMLALSVLTVGLAVGLVLLEHQREQTVAALSRSEENYRTAQAIRLLADAEAARARRGERYVRELLYASDMRLAGEAHRDGDALRARELLDRHIPGPGSSDLRDFVWHALNTEGQVPHQTLDDIAEPLYHVAHSPDGRLLASCGKDAIVRLYAMPGDVVTQEIETGQGEVNGVAFAPDGRSIASAGDDGTIRLWDLETGRERWRAQALEHGHVFQAVFALGGRVLASCGEHSIVRLWNPSTGAPMGELRGPAAEGNHAVEALTVSPDGRYLAAAGPAGLARIWDLHSRQSVWDRHSPHNVRWIAFSPDGRFVLTCRQHGYLTVSDWRSDRLLFEQPVLRDEPSSLALLDGGAVLAVGDRGGMIHLIPNPAAPGPGDRGQIVRSSSWLAHDGRLFALAATPDGRGLISAGADGRLIRWRPFEAHGLRRSLGTGHITNLALGPDGRTLYLTTEQGEAVVIDLADDTRREAIPLGEGVAYGASLSRDGTRLAASMVHRKDRPDGLVVRDLRTNTERLHWIDPDGSHIGGLALSPDGSTLAAYTFNEQRPPGQTVRLALPDLDRPAEARFLPVPDAGNKGLRRRLLAFSPDGRRLATSAGNAVRVLDFATGRLLREVTTHSGPVTVVAFSPDGALLASGGADRRLVLTDLRSGRPILATIAHDDIISAVAFSPDGRLVATFGQDQTLIFWHVPTLQRVLSMNFPGSDHFNHLGYRDLAFSPDGRRLVVQVPHDVIVLDTR